MASTVLGFGLLVLGTEGQDREGEGAQKAIGTCLVDESLVDDPKEFAGKPRSGFVEVKSR